MPVLRNAMAALNAQDDPMAGYVDPWAAMLEQKRKALQQPQAPMFTPEQIAQRRDENERQYQLGILGQLSGDEALGGVGGQVLKQALAGRQQRVTERGTADPITGQFTYSPEYLRERAEQEIAGIEGKQAAGRQAHAAARQAAAEKRELARERAEDQRALRAMMGANEPLVQIMGPNGQPIYVRRSEAIGQAAPGKPEGEPTGEEKRAAGYALRMSGATANLGAVGDAGLPSSQMLTLQALPKVGKTAANMAATPAQQRFMQGADEWIRAKLRKESGASIPPDEWAQEFATYFPMIGDSTEKIEQKAASRRIAEEAMQFEAGRAWKFRPTLDKPAPLDKPGAPKPKPAAAPAAGGLTPAEQAELAELRRKLGR